MPPRARYSLLGREIWKDLVEVAGGALLVNSLRHGVGTKRYLHGYGSLWTNQTAGSEHSGSDAGRHMDG